MPERLRIRCIIAVQLARSRPALPRSMGVFLGGLGTLRPPTRSLQGRHTKPRPGGGQIQSQRVSLPSGSSSGMGQPRFDFRAEFLPRRTSPHSNWKMLMPNAHPPGNPSSKPSWGCSTDSSGEAAAPQGNRPPKDHTECLLSGNDCFFTIRWSRNN